MIKLNKNFIHKIVASIILISLSVSLINVKHASADILRWSYVDTPSSITNVIVSPSEINFIAIGSDDHTFYALDIPDINSSGSHGRFYKSQDTGITWQNELSANLIAAKAFMPVWNFAIAPDDVNLIVAVTDSIGGPTPGGPKKVFFSSNGGLTWSDTNFNAAGWISCVDISITYGGTSHDIAVGTRTGTATGTVYVIKNAGFGSWVDQGLPLSDVVAIKFSPSYPSDYSLVVVSSDATGTQLHLGSHDTIANATSWDAAVAVGYPVLLWDYVFAPPNSCPTASQIITADLELPSDFSGTNQALRRFYVSTDTIAPNVQFGIYRVDDNVAHRINPPTSNRFSSIAYYGTYANGVLLAGEVTASAILAQVNIWRSTNCTATAPAWLKSDKYKSPTGGGNSGLANAQLAWNPNGTSAYCGTSSACLGVFTIPNGLVNCPVAAEWPDGYLKGVPLDESAFSVSPYSPNYDLLLTTYGKTHDTDIGNVWNQLSLIDTEMDRLTDVAALEAPATGAPLTASDYNVLYLFSASDNTTIATRFNSLWRSTTDPLGRRWERILCISSLSNQTILRVKQANYDETNRSQAIVFADLGTDRLGYSANEGQVWGIMNLTTVTDLALSTDNDMFILNDTLVYKYRLQVSSWIFKNKIDSQLLGGHTIAVPLKNPKNADKTTADMVLVGEVGPPNGLGRIAYIDFAKLVANAEPPLDERIAQPVPGDAHVIFDDKFEQDNIIYNATHDAANNQGKIYRWIIGKSTTWDELEPPNTAFYGLAQRNDVLYGAWRKPEVAAILANHAGVDRTLYPRINVPPPPEWDYLVADLPFDVTFTHEPISLKISSNQYNSLWALDNRNYDFINKLGLLWEYTDTASRVGPETTAPPSGSDIPVDPKSGRAVEVNFAWRQLSYSTVYELQIAKDIDFYNRVLVNENIVPVNQLSPEVFTPAGALIPASGSNIASFGNLESGHTYYWRVRSRAAITGDMIRSPWSATMYFTVEAGLPTASRYPSVTLFGPQYGAKNVSTSPGFSWSGMLRTTKYEFILARDPSLQQVVVKADVPTTSYLYTGTLDYNTTYYWQVRAIEPIVSDVSPIGTFTVMAQQQPVTPTVETPAPIPSWIWWIIALFTALVAAIIAFTMVRPGYNRPSGGGKLINVEPIVEKPKGPTLKERAGPQFTRVRSATARIWASFLAAIRRLPFLKPRQGGQPSDSQEKVDTTK
jgi:hypothetical protein